MILQTHSLVSIASESQPEEHTTPAPALDSELAEARKHLLTCWGSRVESGVFWLGTRAVLIGTIAATPFLLPILPLSIYFATWRNMHKSSHRPCHLCLCSFTSQLVRLQLKPFKLVGLPGPQAQRSIVCGEEGSPSCLLKLFRARVLPTPCRNVDRYGGGVCAAD